jgi:class 3 adenylate cyclase/tetratricopeptide (TPR) repeat protein
MRRCHATPLCPAGEPAYAAGMTTCPGCGEENPDRARFCLSCGRSLRVERAERRKLATVLFCDMSGSTAAGERLDSESVRDLMFRYFHEMRSALEDHGGTVEKFIGDAVVAVFGVPVAHEDDALRAVRAAVEMRDRLGRLNEEFVRRFGTRIALRIGLNTGEVVAGDYASRETFVTGDAVNVAARLEETAEPGEIVLGAQTFSLVRHAVDAELLEPRLLKGKSERVRCYRLRSIAAGAAALPRRFDVEFVGRDAELEVLAAKFERAVSRRACELATVVGEPGVGKSRLARALVARLSPRATVLSGRCLPYGDGITFWAVAEVVREAAAIHDEDSPERARDKLSALSGSAEDGMLIADRVAQALGLGEDMAIGAEIASALRRLFERVARSRPLVLLFDDIQWAEQAFLDVLVHLRASSERIFVLCLARPELFEIRPDWEATMRLNPLGPEHSHLLLERLLGSAAAVEVRDRVTDTAGGNPLFVEQLLAMLVDDGLIELREGTWVARGDLADLRLPASLHGLLAARLDRLAPEARATLERGAIEGELFHRGAVYELSAPAERSRVNGNLKELVRHEFLRPAAATFVDDAAFRFRHILIRDAAYEGTTKKLRVELHARFADWLEQKAGARIREYEEVVGYHLEQAHRYRIELGPPDEHARELALRAGEKLASAGRRALGRSDSDAAVKLLSRAVILLPPDSHTRIDPLVDLADALPIAGELEAARAFAKEAIETAGAAGDQRAEWRARVVEAWLPPSTSAPGKAPAEMCRLAEEAIEVFEKLGDERGLGRAWHQLGVARSADGRWEPVLAAAERALQFAESCHDTRTAQLSVLFITSASYEGPTPVAEAIDRCRELALRGEWMPSPHWALARLEAMRGDFVAAREAAAHARQLVREHRSRRPLVLCAIAEGAVEMLAGDPAAAERALRPGCELAREIDDAGHFSRASRALAEAVLAQGRDTEAEQLIRVSRDTVRVFDFPDDVTWRRLCARILGRRGEYEAAEQLARQALSAASATDNLNLQAAARTDLVDVLGGRTPGREGVVLLEDAVRLYEKKGNVVLAARTRAVLTDLQNDGRTVRA